MSMIFGIPWLFLAVIVLLLVIALFFSNRARKWRHDFYVLRACNSDLNDIVKKRVEEISDLRSQLGAVSYVKYDKQVSIPKKEGKSDYLYVCGALQTSAKEMLEQGVISIDKTGDSVVVSIHGRAISEKKAN